MSIYRSKTEDIRKLQELGYLNAGSMLTSKGRDIFNESSDHYYKDYDEAFEKWWKTFPSSDAHKHFPARKMFKQDKAKSRKLFISILELEEVSPEELISALELEIKTKKENSIRTNDLFYLRKPLNYLTGKCYEGWVELAKNEQKSESLDIVEKLV